MLSAPMRAKRAVTREEAVLVTGFEPFGGEPVNPSALAAEALDGRTIGGRRVVGAVIPCVFGVARVALQKELRRVRPELVICVGQAGGRPHIALERVAINVDDAPFPDNAGATPVDRAIAARGPVAYWSTLPIKAIVRALQEDGVSAAVSQTAGTFVCNHVFYGLMHTLRRRRGVRGGFVHVPFLPEQAARCEGGAPSMELDRIVAALEIVIATSLRTRRDLRAKGGESH
jgi:pyroglutamyl-peptidase